jgi:hypothetical protein
MYWKYLTIFLVAATFSLASACEDARIDGEPDDDGSDDDAADDDDDGGGDDDTVADDDDDATADSCSVAEGPFNLTFSGNDATAPSGEHEFETLSCTDEGADVWTFVQAAEESGLTLSISAGPIQEGVLLASGVTVTLESSAGGAGPWSGAQATYSAELYEPPGEPCGTWTVNAFSSGAGSFVTVSPQPVGARCP